MEWITEPDAWAALAALTALEIVLGIDNIVFISILSSRLPPEQQKSARRNGLLLAMGTRILLLLFLSVILSLTEPFVTVFGFEISGRDLILLAGGFFLMAKATLEIHHRLEGDAREDEGPEPKVATYGRVLAQIALLDVVFSLDSVITAVGMARHVEVMVIAVVVSVIVMALFVEPVYRFIERHPTFQMLALSFLVLIGFALVGEGLHLEIPKGYIYTAMGFSLGVEVLNMRMRKKRKPVELHGPRLPKDASAPPT